MPKNRLSLGIELKEASRSLERAESGVRQGAKDTVKQLAVLAEGAMKAEAPEGTGRDVHMRDTIDTRFRRGKMTANVGARKRTRDGSLLAEIIVEGTDSTSYGDTGPPAQPLIEWAAAKLGNPGLGWHLQEQIREGGHETLPNPFVDESLEEWEGQVEDVAGEQVRDAMTRLMRGR